MKSITGGHPRDIPDPLIDWKEFKMIIEDATKAVPKVWCPIKKTMQPWIKIQLLTRKYHPENCCIIC